MLSPEERERIYLEEKARRDARGILRDEEAGAAGFNPNDRWGLIIVGIGLLVFVVLGAVVASGLSKPKQAGAPDPAQSISAKVLEQSSVKDEGRTLMVCEILFENHTSEDIRVFQGTLIFFNLFDEEIARFDLEEDEALAAGFRRTVTRRWEFNPYIREHRRWMLTRQENTRVEWQTTAVVFADGTRLKPR